jgi:hypothetical protein
MIFLLAGAIGLLAGGNAWAKPKTEAGQSTVTANSKTSAKKTVKGKSKLKAAKGTVHVHVLRSTGKSATAATVTIKSGHHKVVRRADRAGRATISIAGHKSAKVKARNNHGAHGSVKTAIAAGMHSSVTVSLHGGRAAAATTGHHHKRHHAHQSKNLGTASGKAAKKTAGHATATPAPAAKPLGVALPAGAK